METQGEQRLRERISNVVSGLELQRFDQTWQDLSSLSLNTRQDVIDPHPDTIRLVDGGFSGAMDVYVLLDYDDRGATRTLAEGFAGSFHGHLDDCGEPVIDRVEVDTSGLFGE